MAEGRGRAVQRCVRAVRERQRPHPFRFGELAETDRQILAQWADGALDLAQDAILAQAPRAYRAILASHFGWQTVSPEPPTFYDYLLLGQLASEERVGHRVRKQAGTTASQEAQRLARLRMFSE